LFAKYQQIAIPALAHDEDAVKTGRRLYLTYCMVCHGSDAGGGPGFPNLRDQDWIYGGKPDEIEASINDGRNGMMPAWLDALGKEGVATVAAYVRSLSGHDIDNVTATKGKAIFDQNCAPVMARTPKVHRPWCAQSHRPDLALRRFADHRHAYHRAGAAGQNAGASRVSRRSQGAPAGGLYLQPVPGTGNAVGSLDQGLKLTNGIFIQCRVGSFADHVRLPVSNRVGNTLPTLRLNPEPIDHDHQSAAHYLSTLAILPHGGLATVLFFTAFDPQELLGRRASRRPAGLAPTRWVSFCFGC